MSQTSTETRAKITWTPRNTVFSEWFERDRSFVGLDTISGCSIVELWDEDVEDFADGFKGLRQSWADALLEYANKMQLTPATT